MKAKCLLMSVTRLGDGQWQRPWQTLQAHDLVLHIQLDNFVHALTLDQVLITTLIVYEEM